MAAPVVLWMGNDHNHPVRYVIRDQINDPHLIDCERCLHDLMGANAWELITDPGEQHHIMQHCLHDLWQQGKLP